MGEEGVASLWAFQGDDSSGVRIKEDIVGGGFGNLPSSPSLFFLVPFPLLLCTFFRLLLLWCLPVQSFITTGLSAHGTEEENAPGSLCDTVMRGDGVIQQFLPKGHICSLSFCSPYLSESLFICRGCTLQSLPGHQRALTTHSA